MTGGAFPGLRFRAASALVRAGYKSREEVEAAFRAGDLNPKTSKLAQFGWGSYRDLASWLGMPEPYRGKPICKHCRDGVIIQLVHVKGVLLSILDRLDTH